MMRFLQSISISDVTTVHIIVLDFCAGNESEARSGREGKAVPY